MNIQGTSKVIAITKDQAQKMKSAYTNQIDAMSLPTEPIAPVTVAPTVEPLTMEDPAMSGVTNADIIGQTPSAPVAPETQPLTTPEAPTVSQDTTQSLAGYPDTSAMSVDELKDEMAKIEQAKKVGELIAEKAKAAGIESVVFDRNGYLYHGRVQALADAAREGGLKF